MGSMKRDAQMCSKKGIAYVISTGAERSTYFDACAAGSKAIAAHAVAAIEIH
jgi:hypothetical protein